MRVIKVYSNENLLKQTVIKLDVVVINVSTIYLWVKSQETAVFLQVFMTQTEI